MSDAFNASLSQNIYNFFHFRMSLVTMLKPNRYTVLTSKTKIIGVTKTRPACLCKLVALLKVIAKKPVATAMHPTNK